ncbi:F510_1955 family glycosylhydrolase [Bacillus sp. SCS-153A]|uniref:F510_1955 family glycosylhydrolase n=1 Tax=Rossellomorea sedimentorum TaxID=3115294 RepID=UPI00390650FA
MKKTKGIFFTTALALVITGCSSAEEEYEFVKADREQIDHIHGAGYPNNGDDFFLATHDGLMKYSEGEWLEANSNKHDYMGFQPYDEGFYSSGHPEQGSDLENPLGLIKSKDQGASIEKLAFYGETDFHYLAAGYGSGVIYVINQHPNSELDKGFYVTEDEGETWKKMSMAGFNSESIGNIAAHPSDKNVVAIGGKDGVFFSDDQGENFTQVADTSMVTSVAMNKDNGLIASIQQDGIQLLDWNVSEGSVSPFPTPSLEGDNPIMYIAPHPQNEQGWTIVTYKNEIYTTEDNGENWKDISDIGENS